MKPHRFFTSVLGVACALAFWTPGTFGHDITEEMTAAANNFLASLGAEKKARATFDWKSDERTNWHFIPKDRVGLSLKDMTTAQRQLAHALLSSGMSHKGYIKAATIMSLEQVLQDIEGPSRRFSRDPALYHVSIFGKPGSKSAWGWRVEGHHLSVNFTIVKGELIAGAPSFFGANPAEIKAGPRKGLRAMAAEEDLGRELVRSLNADQRKVAIIAEKAPRDIITGAQRRVKPLKPDGLPTTKMTEDQRSLMKQLIREYVGRNRGPIAEQDLERIAKAGFDKVHFAWAGGTKPGEGHYYRVQGPTFLLEYDSTQNDANHIHAVFRDFDNDFGEDLLKKHYEKNAH